MENWSALETHEDVLWLLETLWDTLYFNIGSFYRDDEDIRRITELHQYLSEKYLRDDSRALIKKD